MMLALPHDEHARDPEREHLDSSIADSRSTISLSVIMAVAVAATIVRRRGRFSRLRKAGHLADIGPNDKAIDAVITDLRRRMDVPELPVVIDNRADSIGASVVAWGRGQWLVVTRRLSQVADNEPEVVAPVVAHELGHVLQKDSFLWAPTLVYVEAIISVARPLLILNVYLTAVSGHAFSGLAGFMILLLQLWALYQVGVVRRLVVAARKQSEGRADAAAAIFTSGSATIAALVRFVATRRDADDSLHPSRRERINNVYEKVLGWGLPIDAALRHPDPPVVSVNGWGMNVTALAMCFSGSILLALALLSWGGYMRFIYSWF